jgi:hypothetical protein
MKLRLFLAPSVALLALVTFGSVASLTTVSRVAHADPPVDPDVARLSAAGHSLKSTITLPGRPDHYGHAEVLINAPLSRVRTVVTDYAHYKDLVPKKLQNVHVVAKEADHTDLRMEVPVMHGVFSFWYKLRFGPPAVVSPGLETEEGKFVEGNVKDANLVFTMHEVAPAFTVLKIDMLIVPSIPAPQSAIDEELRDAAMNAVDAMHDRAQGNKVQIPFNPALQP